MSDKIILRVFSKAGRSRVEIGKSQTLQDLKADLGKRLSIEVRQLQLFTDDKCSKPLAGRDSASIQSLNLKNGDMLHVGNQSVELASVVASQAAAQKTAPAVASGGATMIDTSGKAAATTGGAKSTIGPQGDHRQTKCRHAATQKCIHCMSAVVKGDEEEKKDGEAGKTEEPQGRCNHASTSKCPNCIGKTGSLAPAKPTCNHSSTSKCPNCMNEDEGMVQDRKHEAFDKYIGDMKRKCSKSHASNQKCQNCTFSFQRRYTVDYNCKYHEPYPKGSCFRCTPEMVVLNRQTYRHLDYVSFMNFKELSKFVDHWRRGGCVEQRCGFLYGYFSEDPNYPEGIRVNIEAIYDPPQISEMNGFIEMDDPGLHKVDMVANALGLERVGTIFTKIDRETILSADEVKKAAIQQQMYSFDHPLGLKVPKFVTVVVTLKDDDVEVNCYMVSDQCQALVNANVFGHSDDRKKLVVRKEEPGEMVPAFLQEGSAVTEVPPEFFVVNVAHGQPAHENDYNIIKSYDFPVKNRDDPATPATFTGYLKKYASDPSEKIFSNFQLLVYLAELMDVDTALTCAQCSAIEVPLDPALMELFRSM